MAELREGVLYAFGKNQEGQLGIGTQEDSAEPAPVEYFTGERRVAMISTGLSHTLALDSSGNAYSYGNNDQGQLGHQKRRLKPETIDLLEPYRIKQVACGIHSSLALTEDGQVLSWGSGERGQLGQGLEAMEGSSKPRFIKALSGHRMVQIACGGKHCLALEDNGTVWAWGENSSGQIGDGTFVAAHTPKPVAALAGRPIRKVACGISHSIALSFSGKIYTWGNNDFGQLGTGNFEKLLRPQILKTPGGVALVDIACGEHHNCFVAKDGRIYTCGAGSNGQLGLQGFGHEASLMLVQQLPRDPDAVVSCGRRHTAVYQPSEQKLYTFGLNGSHQLGHSVGGTKGTSSPFAVKAFAGARIKFVACGGDQTFVRVALPEEPLGRPEEQTIEYLDEARVEELVARCKASGSFAPLQRKVEVVFSSVSCLNASFLSGSHHQTSAQVLGIDIEAMERSYRKLWLETSEAIVNTIGNATSRLVNSLATLKTNLPECMRCFVVLLFNPLFREPAIFHVVCEKLVALIGGLHQNTKDILAGWFVVMPAPHFAMIVQLFQKYLSFLITKLNVGTSVASCCVVLDWLYRVNSKASLLPPRAFYNQEVSKTISIKDEYSNWLSNKNMFSFCRYSFLLDLATKVTILHIDSYRQMTNEVNNYLFQTITSAFPQAPAPHTTVQINANPFLLLKVRRSSLLADTLAQLSKYTTSEVRRPLIVQFEGEEGQDDGGLRKEFYSLITEAILEPEAGYFVREEGGVIWPRPHSPQPVEHFRLLGTLIGMAIYNACLMDLPLPPVFFKKILGWPVGLEDLRGLKGPVARSLQALLDYDQEDVEEVFGLDFQVQELDESGKVINVDLIQDGGGVPVNANNRQNFVELYVRRVLVDSIAPQFEAFAQGFNLVCSDIAIKLFDPIEIETLIRGDRTVNMHELENCTHYNGGYSKEHPVIRNFWTVFHSMPHELQRGFLLFVTGTDRVPIGGLASLRFTIQLAGDTSRLPAAHTCFNILDLPPYPTISEMQQKLSYAIMNTEGFGLV